jgi:hypothetical protein
LIQTLVPYGIKSGDFLYKWLSRRLIETLNQFMHSLKHNAIKIKDEEDKLIWCKNKVFRNYTTKLGYEAKVEEEAKNERKCWWKNIWKLNCPRKMRIFIWLILSNKTLTWDNY